MAAKKEPETEGEKEAREAQEAMDREDSQASTGTGGKALDGEPVNLDDRRRGKTGSQLATDGSEDEQVEEHDGQQAWDVDPSGKKMTTGSLIPRGIPVEYKVKVSGKSVNLRGGLNDPSAEQVTVSALVISKFEIAYIRDADGAITKVIVYEHKVPRAINPAQSEAAQLLLHGAPGDAAAS